MKKVLIIGDSISMGYRSNVKELLKDEAAVVFPEENGRFIKYTVWGLFNWIKELGTPDIIHWNNGLWDVHREVPMLEALTPIEEYVNNISRMIQDINRILGAKIIWASTTPVAEGLIGKSNTDIAVYNNAVAAIMSENGIIISDLNSLVTKNMNYICEDKLHLTEEGYKKCSEIVANNIRFYL